MNTIKNLYHRYIGKLRMIGHVVEAVTLIGCIFTGGYIVGQWVTSENLRENRVELQHQHNMEVERLMSAHREALKALTGSTMRAAAATESAAVAVEAAASVADKAAKQAEKATKQQVKVPVPSQSAINRSVEQANDRLNKK